MDAAEPGKKAGMEVAAGGSIGTALSPNDTSSSDLIGILAAMIILTFTFGTVVAMGMPIVTAILGLTTALGRDRPARPPVAVPDIAHTVATMIGLAVGIDYALFLVTRHRDAAARRDGDARVDRARRGTAGTAVVFAGCTVVVALVSLVVAGIPLVSSLGYTAAVAVAHGGARRHHPASRVDGARPAGTSTRSPCRRGCIPRTKPGKKGIWGTWAAFVSAGRGADRRSPPLILVPLIIPVSS